MSLTHNTQNSDKQGKKQQSTVTVPIQAELEQQQFAAYDINAIAQKARSFPNQVPPNEAQHLQRTIGNQAIGRLFSKTNLLKTNTEKPTPELKAASIQRMMASRSIKTTPPVGHQLHTQKIGDRIQRSYTTFPIAHVGVDSDVAFGKLKGYISTEAVATNNLKFKEEVTRIYEALNTIQPSKAQELKTRLKPIFDDLKDKDKAIANAAKLDTWVRYANDLIADFQLDDAPEAVTASVDEDSSHHMNYNFKLPGDDSAKNFNLDDWSRKGKDFLGGQSSGEIIKGIVNEAVNDWNTDDESIVTLLIKRLLGTQAISGVSQTQNVPALFLNSPIGKNYTKILMATEHILGVRMHDLKPRGVKVEHWKKHAPTVKDNDQNGNINWPTLLKTARPAFKNKMKTTAIADQDEARKIAVAAIAQVPDIARLSGLGILDVDGSNGTFSLNTNLKRHGNDIYQALQDNRFNFDINHFTAILFFEWKAVTDLKQ